jgi:hypothetical protein
LLVSIYPFVPSTITPEPVVYDRIKGAASSIELSSFGCAFPCKAILTTLGTTRSTIGAKDGCVIFAALTELTIAKRIKATEKPSFANDDPDGRCEPQSISLMLVIACVAALSITSIVAILS